MINGSQNPIAGKDEIYTLVNYSLGLSYLDVNPKYTWRIKRLYKGTWVDITKQPQKTGLSAPFQFGPQVVGEKFKLEAYKETKNIFSQKNEIHKMGEIIVIPASSKEPKITKVVLFNRGARDLNKASYTDKLIARAYCVGMFGKTINFHLWEDDAKGGGHNAEINKNNRINKAYPAKVNIDGIAETEISLSADQNVMKQIANRFMMRGDANEGAYHEFYVTASYDGKILGANQTNVDVANPDYKKPQPKPSTPQRTSTPPPKKPQQEENLLAKSINFIVDNVISVFTPEKTKSPAVVNPSQQPQNTTGGCQSCKVHLTVNDLDNFMKTTKHGSIVNKAPFNTRIPAYINYLNQYMTLFEINKNCYRRANFLGQVAKETKFWSYKEDFVYSSTGLLDLKNFDYDNEGRRKANDWGYKSSKSEITLETQIKIGNWAYGRSPKRTDLGNNECPLNKLTDPEQDGYKYRGRGLIQLTGRTNYTNFQTWYNNNRAKLGLPAVDFISNPDMIFEPQYIVLSAIYFWTANNLNDKADKGVDRPHVLAITNIVNRGEDQAKKDIRYDYVKAAYNMLQEKATDCPLTGKKQNNSQNSEWHDPIDNPQITVHDFSGNYDPDFSSFGGHRGRPHTGLDIFAINKKSNVYACLKGKIVYSGNITGYGKTIVIQVDKTLLEKYKKNYSKKYDREEIKGNLYDSGTERYILYSHLDSYKFTKKDVEAGDVIAISGVTGVAEGTHGPHLHIEFTSKMLPQKGDRYKYRCNPLLYINLSPINLELQRKHNKTNKSSDRV